MKNTSLSSEIVEPYAQALMSVAQGNNLTEKIGEDVRSILSLLENSPELGEFLGNPLIEENDKKAVIRQIVGQDTNNYLVSFLMLLVDKRRIIFLEGICQQYIELLRKLNNIVLAEVSSATELNQNQLDSISAKIKAITNAAGVEVQTTIDPNLIGGVIIKVGSQVLDSSLRGQLRRISLSLGAS
ncbi:MAG: ATP synthase F1 subunit delta [Prochloraceae cyanobacterium]|nr:ATP synthase F1 subunit delta [Prochloraceae cyanobacterium]